MSGLVGVNSSEGGVEGRTVFADYNRNGVLDGSEPSAVTDEDGRYVLTNVVAGEVAIREVIPEGWLGTFPRVQDDLIVLVSDQETTEGADLGTVRDGPRPTAVVPQKLTFKEGELVTIAVADAQGETLSGVPLSYSYDLDGDGIYEIYRDLSDVAAMSGGVDGPASWTASVIVHDAIGQEQVYPVEIEVVNSPPVVTAQCQYASFDWGDVEPTLEQGITAMRVYFTGAASDPSPDGDEMTDDWVVTRDGQVIGHTEEGSSMYISVDGPGLYEIRHTAEDEDHAQASASAFLLVTDKYPKFDEQDPITWQRRRRRPQEASPSGVGH